MPTYTDRERLKQAEVGLIAASGASDPILEVGKAHRRRWSYQHDSANTGIANTNVPEVAFGFVNVLSKVKTINFITNANIAADTTDYLVMTVYKRSSAGTQVSLGSWNTHSSAQGAITQWVAASITVNTTSDADQVAASSSLTFELLEFGSGKDVEPGVLTVVGEEI